jgi:hypothetical protein
MMRKSPGRSAAAQAKHTTTRIAGRKQSFIDLLLDNFYQQRDAAAMFNQTWKRPPVNSISVTRRPVSSTR